VSNTESACSHNVGVSKQASEILSAFALTVPFIQLFLIIWELLLALIIMFSCPDFHSPVLRDADISAKPMVLLLGQYSVGKTTFIRYLLGRDFPGIRIGPEPTTDRFVCLMSGPDDRTIPGNALSVHPELPFTSLSMFGANFLNRLEGSQCSAPLLEHISLIDTPGVLSGEKQRIGRSYDFVKVVEWFAGRADLILLLFDAHKLDISDEFRDTIMALQGNEDKVRVVLNKADKVTGQQLMRVYGSMMWSLGKVVQTPEVMRVYIGSFWDEECSNKEFESLFIAESSDLLRDLRELPRNAAIRKINEMVKRARLLRTHALLVGHLRNQMPAMWGFEKKQKELIADMANQFNTVHKKYSLPVGDFPDMKRFQAGATALEFKKFPKLDDSIHDKLSRVLEKAIPHLLEKLQDEEAAQRAAVSAAASATSHMLGGAAAAAAAGGDDASAPPLPKPGRTGTSGASNPFSSSASKAPGSSAWESLVMKGDRDLVFETLEGADQNKVPGGAAFVVLSSTGLAQDKLRRIWDLSDIDKDGALTGEEFALCMHLVDMSKAGKPIPTTLPAELVPPSYR